MAERLSGTNIRRPLGTNHEGDLVWVIPDGFLPATSQGQLESHEATCVLNTGAQAATLQFEVYFEDREPLMGFTVVVPARRTNHIHLESLVNGDGQRIPRGVPYALRIVSDQPVVVQHSRLDTTQPALSLMTTMGYAVR
ncbi:MAG: sensory rhodopsin transducer [Firmicutes bacterium]|nr:sensory rhodopsin transducer [Bacillota bacterium]